MKSFQNTAKKSHMWKIQQGLLDVFPDPFHKTIKHWIKKYSDDPGLACIKIWTQHTQFTKTINFALMLDAYQTFNLEGHIDVSQQITYFSTYGGEKNYK